MKYSSLVRCQVLHYLFYSYNKQMKHSHRNKIFLDYNVIFVHVPKCAGTAMYESLFGQRAGLGHKTCEQYLKIYGASSYFSTYKFGFVRNPYDRLVSAYEYLKNGGNNSQDLVFSKHVLSDYKDFNDFVLNGIRQDVRIQHHIHFKPQHYFLTIDGETAVDFLGRYENIENDYKIIASTLGVESSLVSRNSSLPRKRYSEYYCSEEVKKVVADFYQKDFELFKYSFDV